MTVQEFINFINQDQIIETLIKNKIYNIILKQKDTYRPIGMIVTDVETKENGNIYYSEYQLEIPYNGIDPQNAQIKTLQIQPGQQSILEIQDNSIPNDKHVPVYYKQTVYDGQDVIYLIAKVHYDDIVMRTEYLDVLSFDLNKPKEKSNNDMRDYYTDKAPVIYEYHYEIRDAIASWQTTKLHTWYNHEKEYFTGGMTALSRPIDEIKTLMREHGFELEPAPKSFNDGELHKVLVIEHNNTQKPFLIAVTPYTNRFEDPTITEIRKDLIEYQTKHQCASAEELLNKINDYTSVNQEYWIDVRPMNPNTENCSDPEIIIQL